MMALGNASLIAFLATTDAARARTFYEGTLGLQVVEDSPFALVVDADGTMVRIQKVEAFTPHPFTALGWGVDDVTATVRDLAKKGIAFNRYPGLEQDADGVWTSPAGARIAWFSDPDGNVLSLTEFG
jgi:catechol 2,3-dioxygenase-like lactoylglutathione lyase family enzyme